MFILLKMIVLAYTNPLEAAIFLSSFSLPQSSYLGVLYFLSIVCRMCYREL